MLLAVASWSVVEDVEGGNSQCWDTRMVACEGRMAFRGFSSPQRLEQKLFCRALAPTGVFRTVRGDRQVSARIRASSECPLWGHFIE